MRYSICVVLFLLLLVPVFPSTADEGGQQVAMLGRGALNSATYAPDGDMIGVATSAGVYIYDSMDTEPRLLDDLETMITDVAFSPDGSKIAATGMKSAIGRSGMLVGIWDVASGELIAMMESRAGRALTFTPDGSQIVSVHDFGDINVWDAETGDLVRQIEGQENNAYDVAFARDGEWLVVGAGDIDSHRIYDFETGDILLAIENGRLFTTIAIDRAGTRLFEEHFGKLWVWDAETGEEIPYLEENGSRLSKVAISPDGSTLAYGHTQEGIYLVDAQSLEQIALLETTGSYASLSFNRDGSTLMAANRSSNDIQFWDIASGALVTTIEGFTDGFTSLDLSANVIAAGDSRQSIYQWDMETYEALGIVSLESCCEVISIDINTDGTAVVADSVTSFEIRSLETGEQLTRISPETEGFQSMEGVAYLNGDTEVLALSEDGFIRRYDIETGDLLSAMNVEEAIMISMTLSPDATQAVTGDSQGNLYIWDIESASLISTIVPPDIPDSYGLQARAVAFDGTYVAAGFEWRNDVQVWDAASGELVATMPGHSSAVRSLSFNDDGSLLASGSVDSTVRVWDTGSWSGVAEFTGHGSTVHDLQFDDAGLLYSASSDGTVRIWQLD